MAVATPDAFDHRHRSAAGCLCCGNPQLRRETQIVSGFLALRAWGGPPETTQLASCDACGFRFFDRGLDEVETARYYRGYRNAEYMRGRWRWEPFYTHGQHLAQIEWARAPKRVEALRTALALSRSPPCFDSALDHGGSEGHMLAGVVAVRKAVFDPSGQDTLHGIERFTDSAQVPSGWHLILSCQVLEHVSAPSEYLHALRTLLADGGYLYIEVPAEKACPAIGAGPLRDAMLRQLLRLPPLLVTADVLCTISRIKLGRLPPLGFLAMREHLNYFSRDALVALLARCGYTVDVSGINDYGQLFAIARQSDAPGNGAIGTGA